MSFLVKLTFFAFHHSLLLVDTQGGEKGVLVELWSPDLAAHYAAFISLATTGLDMQTKGLMAYAFYPGKSLAVLGT